MALALPSLQASSPPLGVDAIAPVEIRHQTAAHSHQHSSPDKSSQSPEQNNALIQAAETRRIGSLFTENSTGLSIGPLICPKCL